MTSDPRAVIRRLVPDQVQFQVILGSLLGDALLVGSARQQRMRIAHRVDRRDYLWWKYDRLGPFAYEAPRERDGIIGFETVTHPIFDDLDRLLGDPHGRHDAIARLLRPLGLAVWLADVGRLDLRASTFLPAQRELALAS